MTKVTNWRCVLMIPAERLVFEALDDPDWDARTIPGIARSTGLSESEILKILNTHASLVEAYNTQNFGLVFKLKNPTHSGDLVEKALDYMSMGNRRRIA